MGALGIRKGVATFVALPLKLNPVQLKIIPAKKQS